MLPLALVLAITQVTPSDPRIVYVGRFDANKACQWSASEVRAKVKGPKLDVKIEEHGNDFWQIVVDGKPTKVIKPKEGVDTYSIGLQGTGVHDVELVKRTEAFVGTTTFRGFATPGGQLLKAEPKKRHIEVVGDSITCGYGNEGASQNEKFKPETENAYMSYASIAARAVNADVTIIAWSGRKMWPDNTTPEIYDRILPMQPKPLYDFKGPKPDAVIINLATNDFGGGNPDEKKWTAAYEAFIKRIWSYYPKARVYATIGSMMNDFYPAGNKALTTLRGYLTRMVAKIHDPRLKLLEFEPQKQEDGIGSDWHPNIKTDHKMGAKLAEALKRDLKW